MPSRGRSRWVGVLAAGLSFAPAAACGVDGAGPVSRRTLAENYRGPEVREYFVEGTSTVSVEPTYVGDGEREARALELVGYKHVVIDWFLYRLIADTIGSDGEPAAGGLHAHVRNGAIEDLELTAIGESTYAFRFRGEISAPLDLFDLLPDPGPADAGPDGDGPPDAPSRLLHLRLPVLDNEEMSGLEPGSEWYRSWAYSSFDPDTYAGELEAIDLAVTPEERSLDGYIDHRRLLEDGRLTVGIHIGWDYNTERYDLQHAMQLYSWLVDQGFDSPVASFDYYAPDSGPLTRSVRINGTPVAVEVTLVHARQGNPRDPDFALRMKQAMLDSLREREVIIYLGHSGNHRGFLLGNWLALPMETAALADWELPAIPMSDAYQIVLADGCHTYSMGEPFYANPAKSGRTNLDLVATTNFSITPDAGDHAVWLLSALFGTDDRPPRGTSYDQLLGWYRPMETYMGLYGVHGIDDNPRLNPLADPALLCVSCEDEEACGATGNACLHLVGGSFCLPECLSDDACPVGTTCRVHESGREWGRPGGFCTPDSGTCPDSVPGPEPDAGTDGDLETPDDAADTPVLDALLPPADLGGEPPAGGEPDDALTADSGCGCRAAAAARRGSGHALFLLALAARIRKRTNPGRWKRGGGGAAPEAR